MDDSPIQTALCVIGHPIGGNPTQFVALRALSELGLDWQVISFDVDPSQISNAIGGIDSLGFCGAMIAVPYQTRVAQLLSANRGNTVEISDDSLWHDCLHRDHTNKLVATNVFADALKRLVESHVSASGKGFDRAILIGDEAKLSDLALPLLPAIPESRWAVIGAALLSWPLVVPNSVTTTDSVVDDALLVDKTDGSIEASPSLVVWAIEAKPSKKPSVKPAPHTPSATYLAELLLQLHPDSMLVDLSGTSSAWLAPRIEENDRKIAIVNQVELDVLRLAIAIQHWTGKQPNVEIMREAIEEYLEI